MKKKNRAPASPGRKRCRQSQAEKQAVKKFNSELQKAVEKVDWGMVKLARQQRSGA